MTISTQDFTILVAALDSYATVPAALTEVETLVAAAEAHLADVRAATAPDLSKLSAANLRKTADAMFAWKNRGDLETVALQILNHAEAQRSTVAMTEAYAMLETFRPAFDSAAAEFTTALGELGGNTSPEHAIAIGGAQAHTRMKEAGAVLTHLATIRSILAAQCGTANLMSDRYDHPTRLATFSSRDVFARALPVRAGSAACGSTEWFAAVLSIPGCAIKWQTPAEQVAHVSALPAETAYTAAAGA